MKKVDRSNSSSVWLRKRVVERFFTKSSPSLISFDDLNRFVHDRIKHIMSDQRVTAILQSNLTFRQIGPSCGLCALAMAYVVFSCFLLIIYHEHSNTGTASSRTWCSLLLLYIFFETNSLNRQIYSNTQNTQTTQVRNTNPASFEPFEKENDCFISVSFGVWWS